ncbi:helix-turn-helix transcriptional regulator [Rhizobium sp. ARZ01]|uniref:helix-turn-helix domain-containing protein n=1 Tax=Rhizobium sp. ARZ01 TaxID=2769313 RepID=UPI00177BE975|nr:helix-turn-helix transcriptional regulator [Rhizobium sp. ARZ01]MBD9375420.1 helix-turn-helix transcriptional regulator [Rhizobium sp. ARZ01]
MPRETRLFGERELRQLGRSVRSARKEAGITQSQLSERSGLSPRVVRELEAGRSNPTLATIVAIVDVLSITLDDLIGAARSNRVIFDVLPAAELRHGDNELTRLLPRPRLKARLLDLDVAEPVSLPEGSAFAHVLSGSVGALLDDENLLLRQGDSLHSRPGVLKDLAVRSRARILLVEAVESIVE